MKAKLTYFDMTGLGEPVRLMLVVAKIPFEDVRLDKRKWDALKPTLRWPFLPILEIDGIELHQSRTISRYIARKAGLVGSSDIEAALCDAAVDDLDDMRVMLVRHYYTPDSPEREENMKRAIEIDIPIFLHNFEEQISENGGYLVGGKLTWADVILLANSDYLNHIASRDLFAEYPGLQALASRVKALPAVSDWLASRPKQPDDLRTLFV